MAVTAPVAPVPPPVVISRTFARVASAVGKTREAIGSYFAVIKPAEGSDIKTADEVKVRLQNKIKPAEAGWQIVNCDVMNP